MKAIIVEPTITYSHDQLMRDAYALKTAYPGLIQYEDAGYSAEGRALPLIRLGTGRAGIFCCGAHHAREYITSAYLMYAVNVYAHMALAKKRAGGFDMEKLLTDCSMYVMPMVNPDGTALAQGGLKAVQQPENVEKMTLVRPSYFEWKANVNGVDLNRHYPALWDSRYKPIDTPASELYSGDMPGTEPEVKTVMRICRSHAFRAALSFHTKGESIAYADAATREKTTDAPALAQSLADISRYALLPPDDNPGIFAASFETWFRNEFLRSALLVRLAPAAGGVMPVNERDFFPLVWKKGRYICAQAMEAVKNI